MTNADACGPALCATVVGRRIRLVTVEPDTYELNKAKTPGLWSASVSLIEKEIGHAPGYLDGRGV